MAATDPRCPFFIKDPSEHRPNIYTCKHTEHQCFSPSDQSLSCDVVTPLAQMLEMLTWSLLKGTISLKWLLLYFNEAQLQSIYCQYVKNESRPTSTQAFCHRRWGPKKKRVSWIHATILGSQSRLTALPLLYFASTDRRLRLPCRQ